MISNGAFSAPNGYDLRAPFNVPAGNIRCMRVVPAFSISSLQRDTITEEFERSKPPIIPSIPVECLPLNYNFYYPTYTPCRGYSLASGFGPPSNLDRILSKLMFKDSLIK
ncbi:unnamed protein product [Allacma fusca]|uniref:Uncharacterized protein n=1 Tax=Allacma fusca TaxID=39272 RepID=A0A8J2LVI5_9HEXA|nr:unnamed protein product [Allacma fusca]